MALKLAIFDVCNTFVSINTTYSFIKFVCENKKYNYKKYLLIQKLLQMKFYRIIGDRLYRRHMVSILRGMEKKTLYRFAEEFVSKQMLHAINQEVLDLLDFLKKDNYECLIISASVEPPIVFFSQKVGIKNHFASLLEYSNNSICSGRIKEDLLANKDAKVDKLEDFYGDKIDFKNSYLITDKFDNIDSKKFGHIALVVDNHIKKISKDSIKTLFLI